MDHNGLEALHPQLPYCAGGRESPGHRWMTMKVDLYDAPLSHDAEEMLKDPGVVHDLLIKIMEAGERRHFEVKSGDRTLEVTASAAVAADTEA
jgi:hypothetical protein